MEKHIKGKSLTNCLAIITILFFNFGCSSQTDEESFLNQVADQHFKEIIQKIKKVEDYGLKKYRFTDLSKPKSEGAGFEFNQMESNKYLGFPKDSLYDKVEFYNHDDETVTYGDTKEILPYSWIKAFLSENLVSLFVAKSNGVNDGDLDMYYLFILDYEGRLVDHIILSKQMITYDGIRPNHFGFLDKKHFNRYIYDSKRIDKGENKMTFDNFCIIEKYEIDDNGKISLLDTIQKDLKDDPKLNYGRYLDLKEIPEDDPMRIFIE